jgi:hypothetical protein
LEKQQKNQRTFFFDHRRSMIQTAGFAFLLWIIKRRLTKEASRIDEAAIELWRETQWLIAKSSFIECVKDYSLRFGNCANYDSRQLSCVSVKPKTLKHQLTHFCSFFKESSAMCNTSFRDHSHAALFVFSFFFI